MCKFLKNIGTNIRYALIVRLTFECGHEAELRDAREGTFGFE